MFVRFPFSFRNVEDLLDELGIEIFYVTVPFSWEKFDPMFTREVLRNRIHPNPNSEPKTSASSP